MVWIYLSLRTDEVDHLRVCDFYLVCGNHHLGSHSPLSSALRGDCGQAVSWGLCPPSWKHKLSCWRSVRKSHTLVPDNSLLSLEKPFWRKPLKDGLLLVSPMSGPALQVYLSRSTPLRNSARGKDFTATKAMISASFLALLWSLRILLIMEIKVSPRVAAASLP